MLVWVSGLVSIVFELLLLGVGGAPLGSSVGGGRPILPVTAHVIVEHYRSSCGGAEVPFQMDGRIALMCNFIESIYHDCLGSRRPMFVGRNCRGQRCVFDFAGPDAICLYRAYGQPVHPFNKTLASTCGLESDDPNFDYRNPRPLPPLGESLFDDPSLKYCGRWLPEGISGTEWTECVNGVPIAKIELTFEKEMPSDVDYTCLITPECSQMDYIQQILCYVELDEGENEEPIDSKNVVKMNVDGVGGYWDFQGIENGVEVSVLHLYKVLSVIVLAMNVATIVFGYVWW